MNRMNRTELVKEQYRSTDNLNIRITLHEKYSTNRQGFGNWILEQYRFFPGCRILELGCGTGDLWESHTDLLPASSELILSDFSQGMVTEVQKKFAACPHISCQKIDIANIPFPNCSFDWVIANMMLYHVPNLEGALAEAARVLKPGGHFAAATYGEHGIADYLEEHLHAYGFSQKVNNTFTLQNGNVLLSRRFRTVERCVYPDALEVTETKDLVDYILSMTSMTNLSLDRAALFAYFEAQKNECGVIRIPKEYGMFLCTL